MRIKLGIISLCIIIFASCSDNLNLDANTDCTFPSYTYFYTLPDKAQTLTFPEEHRGKECFIIYTNEETQNLHIAANGISIKREERTANAKQHFTVENAAINIGDGFYRQDVSFELPVIENQTTLSGRSARAITTSKYYRDPNNPDFFIASNSSDIDALPKAFTKKYEGNHCRIWYLKKSRISIADTEFSKLGQAIDEIFTGMTQIFGSNSYNINSSIYIKTNNETKIDVLVYDLFGDADENQKKGTFGFFNPYDFYLNKVLSDKTSNEAQVIHIDSFFLSRDISYNTQKVKSTLIHEFQHLLNFCNKAKSYNTWYTEMLSLCAEDIFQNTINLRDDDSPKSRFYEDFNRPWIGFLNWPASQTADVYNAYANIYAFGAFLLRNYGGIQLFHEIATNKYVNEASITNALQKLGYKEDFYSVLRKFGMIYIFADSDANYSLKKSFQETFYSKNYNISQIRLNNYYFKSYDTKEKMDYDYYNILYNKYLTGIYYLGEYLLKGPRIYLADYHLSEEIRPYGFCVYYMGTVEPEKTYQINNSNNLTISVVVRN